MSEVLLITAIGLFALTIGVVIWTALAMSGRQAEQSQLEEEQLRCLSMKRK